MGGIASALGEGAEKLGTAVTEKLADTGVGRGILSLVGNKENELKLTPQGKAVGDLLGEYHRIKTASLHEYNKNLKTVIDWHQGDDVARNSVPLRSATVDDIHNHAVGRNHPIQKATQALLDQDINPKTGVSRNADLTLKELSLKNKGQARLVGMAGSVGDKMQHVAPLIADMLEHPDPRVQMNGNRVADIVSNELRDTELMTRGNTQSLQSSAKTAMNKTFDVVNRVRAKAGVDQKIPMLRTDPTYYAPSEAEGVASKILHTIQIPFVAIPHVGQYFHIAATAPLESIGKALLMMDRQNMMNTIDASGILANTEWDVIHSDLAARTGKIAQWTDQPTAASILSKTIHTPGFNWMRLRQLAASGAVGYHSAILWGHNLMKNPADKLAHAELTEMGIDPVEVLKQGGKLTPEQLQKGVYHFTNNRFFIDKSVDRALWSNKNFFLRSASMYHGFISSETAFLRREFIKQMKSGNIKSIAQYAGTIGVLFPAVAPMIKSLEILARTGSPAQAGQSVQQDYSGLTFQNGPVNFAETYLDMVAHLGAMGAAYNYTNAIKGHKLANALIGPMIGMAATDTEDVVNAIKDSLEKGPEDTNFAPLGRDVLQTIPVAGKPLSHKLFPTKKEQQIPQ